MSTLYVARSATLSKWASDVGLSRYIFKVGIVAGGKSAIEPVWAGLDDWKIIKRQECSNDCIEQQIIERLATKAKMLDPKLYPRIRGTPGLYKVTPAQVENYVTLTRALAGAALGSEALKPADFADYLIHASGIAG